MKIHLLHHYLEQTAARLPDKTVIRDGSRAITYGELNRLSDALARQLHILGMKHGEPVGIYLNKSIEAITAMFAVLKAGGAYVPLDAQYSPVSRVMTILKASGLALLVSDLIHIKALKEALPAETCLPPAGLKAVLMDMPPSDSIAEWSVSSGPIDTVLFDPYSPGSVKIPVASVDPVSSVAQTSTVAPVAQVAQASAVTQVAPVAPRTSPGDQAGTTDSLEMLAKEEQSDTELAYILYTSGSTGTPKGVMLSHLNAKTFIAWALAEFKPDESDQFSSIAPLHFDLSVFDIYVAIACGGTVHLAPAAGNPRAFLAWLRESMITYVYSVPSVWTAIMNYAGLAKGDLPRLTNVLFAGEVFPPQALRSLMEHLPHAAFYNLYGPTETNVCTYYPVTSAAGISERGVPIGKACAGTEVIALNENGEELSAGDTGELLVRGPIVTTGYYKNPELTAAAFAQGPQTRHNTSLFYRTGDLVRLTISGDFEYLGRKDLMIKLAGFRIELPEVEQALFRHSQVSEAVVVPVCDGDRLNAKSLTAFLTLKEGEKPGIVAIKNFLTSLLPRYMIPEGIVFLDAMPRNGNGKADRLKLTKLAGEGYKYGNQ